MSGRKPYKSGLSDERWALVEPVLPPWPERSPGPRPVDDRLCRWTEAGVFDQVHRMLLAELNAARRIDWTRACVDASHVRAKRGGLTSDLRRSTVAGRAASTT